MSATRVQCSNCGQTIPAVDINISSMMAKCANCDHVFPLDVPDNRAALPDSAPSRPSGIVHETGYPGELVLSRRWFHAALFGLLFFCIAWDAFLVFWYVIALFGEFAGGKVEWIMVIFPIGHVAVGVGLTYYVLAGFLNKSTLTLDFDTLTVRHGPIPWKGNQSLLRDDILELELEFGGFRSIGTRGMSVSLTISAHHRDGRQIILLTSVPQRQAEYIAWHLADALDVKLTRQDQSSLSTTAIPGLLHGLLSGRRNRRS